MRIIATPIPAHQLKPGDLFSTADQRYWDLAMAGNSIGERVYIRMQAPAYAAPDGGDTVYRITIETDSPIFQPKE
jgi:hypothetical protein